MLPDWYSAEGTHIQPQVMSPSTTLMEELRAGRVSADQALEHLLNAQAASGSQAAVQQPAGLMDAPALAISGAMPPPSPWMAARPPAPAPWVATPPLNPMMTVSPVPVHSMQPAFGHYGLMGLPTSPEPAAPTRAQWPLVPSAPVGRFAGSPPGLMWADASQFATPTGTAPPTAVGAVLGQLEALVSAQASATQDPCLFCNDERSN